MSTKDDLDTTDHIEAQQGDSGDCSHTTCSRLIERDGYKAFEKVTREMLDRAQNAKPRRPRKGYKARAEYREGYHDGILAVWCMLALVKHPRHPINAEQIRRILSSENEIGEPAADSPTH